MLDKVTQSKDIVVMYDPEIFDTPMSWKEIVNYKKEKGTSPKGCVVLTLEEYQRIEELVDEIKQHFFAEGIKEAQGD